MRNFFCICVFHISIYWKLEKSRMTKYVCLFIFSLIIKHVCVPASVVDFVGSVGTVGILDYWNSGFERTA